jgi:hypothetical protein
MELLVVVEGCALNENKSGDWLNSLGKFASFKKLIEMLAIEFDEDVAWEL